MVRWALSLVLTAQFCWASAGSTEKGRDTQHPNVILITLDTTRADRMGFLGSKRGLTPNLDGLARQANVFAHAYAQVPLTTPSHAAILTGTYPQFNHVNYMGDPLSPGLPYLPDILHQNGYRTGAFVGALVLESKKLAFGFERGFDVYDAGYRRRAINEDRYKTLERRGDEVVRRALAWLGKPSGKPFFLWVHLYDPHDPYDPPEPYKTRWRDEPYDGEIAYTDAAVGRLIAVLRTRRLFDSALIAVMADHGEAFGEHGENHHGIFLYDETIHVPLVIKMPGQRTANEIPGRVGLVDVAPTILGTLKLAVPADVQGNSLLKLMKSRQATGLVEPGDPNANHPVYSESSYGLLSFGWSKLQAWRSEKYLYIQAPHRELYDLVADPLARHNVAGDSKAVADTAAAQVAEFYEKTKGSASETTSLNSEQAESLHALGYMGSAARPSAKEDQGGTDPKDKIAIANLLYDALVDAEQERFQDSVPLLDQVLKEEPNTPIALLQLGRAYVALKEYEKAVTPLENLVKRKPEDAFAQYELGCALVKTGRWDEAQPHFEAAVSQTTTSAMMHFYLAMVYERTSRLSDAIVEFQNAVRLDPDNFPANLLLGRRLVMQQKAAEALLYLSKAEELRPDSIDVHRFLSDVYMQLGQAANAERENAEAERIRLAGGSRLGTPKEKTSPGQQRP